MSVATFLQDAHPKQVQDNKIIIALPKHSAFHKELLETKDNIGLVEEILREKLGCDIFVEYKISGDVKKQEDDAAVKKVLDIFGAEVVNKWHRQ